MSKQFAVFHISWRDAKKVPMGLFADSRGYGRAAAAALQDKLNALADEGWIVHEILPVHGFTAKETAAYTLVMFR